MTASPLTARFPLLDRPVAVPGACMCCNKGNVRVFDTRRNFFQHGAAYICEECVLEMAHTLNLVPAEQVSAVREEAKQSISSYLTQQGMRVITDELYNLLTSSLDSVYSAIESSNNFVSLALGDDTVEELSPNAGDIPAEPESKPEPKRRGKKQTDSDAGNERPASISGSSGDGASAFDL